MEGVIKTRFTEEPDIEGNRLSFHFFLFGKKKKYVVARINCCVNSVDLLISTYPLAYSMVNI